MASQEAKKKNRLVRVCAVGSALITVEIAVMVFGLQGSARRSWLPVGGVMVFLTLMLIVLAILLVLSDRYDGSRQAVIVRKYPEVIPEGLTPIHPALVARVRGRSVADFERDLFDNLDLDDFWADRSTGS
jgi:uncharacterized membrane protein